MAIVLVLVTTAVWAQYLASVTAFYVSCMVFITFVCPWMLIRAQKYKRCEGLTIARLEDRGMKLLFSLQAEVEI
jgi:Phosphatidylinositol N-acetylglucosaminyltransferase